MELFSEIYGCYYTVIAHILREAYGKGLARGEIARIVEEKGFSESGLHLLPKLLSGEWDLLEEAEGRYRSKLAHRETELPLTLLEKSWLKALLADRRIRLFLDGKRIAALEAEWSGVEPLFRTRDFHVFDEATDGDSYGDEDYIRRFRLALEAIRGKQALQVEYENARGERKRFLALPLGMQYSPKDDKFRLSAVRLGGKGVRMLLNMARITGLERSEPPPGEPPELPPPARARVTLAISGERNALERCMLQFASYDKRTSYHREQGRYLCEIRYNPQEESELLIRILSFGPVVEVLEPESFRGKVRERVERQLRLLE